MNLSQKQMLIRRGGQHDNFEVMRQPAAGRLALALEFEFQYPKYFA